MMNTKDGTDKAQRFLLKLSGEALLGQAEAGISPDILAFIAAQVAELLDLGIELGIVIGGGNLFRGAALVKQGMNRVTGDHMGMLATVMNALALRDAIEQFGHDAEVMSAIPLGSIARGFNAREAKGLLTNKKAVIFAAGTGNPFFTTDTTASLRSIEIDAQCLIKATNVDGVYDSDPRKNAQAKLFQQLSYKDALEKELGVMDLTAFSQCRDHNMPIRVVNIHKQGALLRAIRGEAEGTLVSSGETF